MLKTPVSRSDSVQVKLSESWLSAPRTGRYAESKFSVRVIFLFGSWLVRLIRRSLACWKKVASAGSPVRRMRASAPWMISLRVAEVATPSASARSSRE